jgi:branched-chain amino acid transport system substrate-binding protein
MQGKKIVIGLVVVVAAVGSYFLFFQNKGGEQADVAGETIKIVTSMPIRGGGIGGPMVEGIKLAMEEAHYKAGKFTIDWQVIDDGNASGTPDLDVEKKNATEAAADPNVMVYLGPANSGATKASIPIINAGGLAQLSPSASYPGLTLPGYAPGEPGILYPTKIQTFFRTAPTVQVQAPAGAIWAKELGMKTIYVINDSDPSYGMGVTKLFVEKASEIGLTVVADKSISGKDMINLNKIIDDVVKVKPDMVYYGGLSTGGIVPFIKGIRAKGSTAKVMGSHGILSGSFLPDLGKDAEGVYGTSNSGDTVSSAGIMLPEEKAANDRFAAQFGHEPGFLAMTSYEGAKVVLAAIEKAGKKDRAAILAALASTKDYPGIFGKWSFKSNGDTDRIPRVSGNVVKKVGDTYKFEYVKPLN